MLLRGVFVLAVALLCLSDPARAVDLHKIERKIAREPAYQSTPRYCLLVFGPEARTRIWLVIDEQTLYVDRNGNGDLTEPGNKVTLKQDGDSDDLRFNAGDLRDGKLLHKSLAVSVRSMAYRAFEKEYKDFLAKNPRAVTYAISLDVEMPGWKGGCDGGRIRQLVSSRDLRGILQFASSPKDAPIIHFGGPWRVCVYDRPRFAIGRESDLVLGLGTPGFGPGTTAYYGYENLIPEKAYPKVEITYPVKEPGKPPIKELCEIKGRC